MQKVRKMAGVGFVVLGVVSFFLAYIQQRMPYTFWAFLCAVGIGFAVVGVVHLFRTSSTLPKPIIVLIHVLAGLLTLSFVMVEWNIIDYGARMDTNPTDAVVVLGAGLDKDQVTNALAYRLDAALALTEQLPDNVPVVVSGGQGADETIAEAEAMERYLIERGFPQERILKESASTSTFENMCYTRQTLSDAGFDARRITVVTNNFHMRRASLLAKRAGFEEVFCYGAPLDDYLKLTYYLREYFATVKSYLFDR